MRHDKLTTNLKTANLILGALSWRIDGSNNSAMLCADSAIRCAMHGDAEGCARQALQGLLFQVGIGHPAYGRAFKLATQRK